MMRCKAVLSRCSRTCQVVIREIHWLHSGHAIARLHGALNECASISARGLIKGW